MALPPHTPPVGWRDGAVELIDQRGLPHEQRLMRIEQVDELVGAIRDLAVRGAPAIGHAGAFGVALSARLNRRPDGRPDRAAVRADAERLMAARPTAVNLPWAVGRALDALADGTEAVLAEAHAMVAADAQTNGVAAARAADLVQQLAPDRPLRLLTHCNTGRLATAAVGTALGTVLELARRGLVEEVLVGETRPLLQGARLTAWELGEAGVPYRIVVDSAAAAAMSRGMVDCVLVGADRIAANGDTANKIGTYGLAVAARHHGIPFVVVAPESTWDRELADGGAIVVEERAAEEVTAYGGVPVAPGGARAFNPAFDVTPAGLITALVSAEGVVRPATAGLARPAAAQAAAPAPAPAGAGPGGDATATTTAQGAPGAQGRSLADSVAALSRVLHQRGWMPGTSGNISARTAPGAATALITASGGDKGEVTADDLVTVRVADAAPFSPGGPRPSAETSVHMAVYRATGADAVLHVHSPYATAVASRAAAGPTPVGVPLLGFELLKGLGLADPARTDLPVFPNWPDVSRIADDVEQYLRRTPDAPPGLLIADHGITAWGRDLGQARNRLECLEAICRLLVLGARSDRAPRTVPLSPVLDPEGPRR
ncbi:S-methyl-5-thioribose-1-phosphate isomerase [Streptomyces sp. NPDC127106]|uniref:S-methyl-5-thioribose-1-phosphate isomerase n=1 Tax=Streptomyces sp. NPDC127106 TaxID=3345360 RepID=UPI00363CAA2B